jgi:hypothetical protein
MKDRVHGKLWQGCLYVMENVFSRYCFMIVVVYDMFYSCVNLWTCVSVCVSMCVCLCVFVCVCLYVLVEKKKKKKD